MQIETEDYVSLRQASESLGVTRSSLHIAILRGTLTAIAPWGSYLVDRDSLEAYRRRTQPDGIKVQGRPRKNKKEMTSGS